MAEKYPDFEPSTPGGHAAEQLKEFLQQRFEETTPAEDEIENKRTFGREGEFGGPADRFGGLSQSSGGRSASDLSRNISRNISRRDIFLSIRTKGFTGSKSHLSRRMMEPGDPIR
jgi:hypothetical protein